VSQVEVVNDTYEIARSLEIGSGAWELKNHRDRDQLLLH
jgi:hypothetical protein